MPLKFSAGVKITSVPTRLTVPPIALPTAVSVNSALVLSTSVSFAVRLANEIVRLPESSAMLDRLSSTATGASFTAVIVKLTEPVSVRLPSLSV